MHWLSISWNIWKCLVLLQGTALISLCLPLPWYQYVNNISYTASRHGLCPCFLRGQLLYIQDVVSYFDPHKLQSPVQTHTHTHTHAHKHTHTHTHTHRYLSLGETLKLNPGGEGGDLLVWFYPGSQLYCLASSHGSALRHKIQWIETINCFYVQLVEPLEWESTL